MTKTYLMSGLVEKVANLYPLIFSMLRPHRPQMQSPDQDFRYSYPTSPASIVLTLPPSFMGLNDLMNEIKQDPNNFLGDEATENKVLRQVMALVEDKISEVKNQAVKWSVLFNVPIPPPLSQRLQSGSDDQNHPGISNGLCSGQTYRFLFQQGRGT